MSCIDTRQCSAPDCGCAYAGADKPAPAPQPLRSIVWPFPAEPTLDQAPLKLELRELPEALL